jgi:GT2 family glycosyltransferase
MTAEAAPPTALPRVPGLTAIVIVNWNGWLDTVECLRSCRQLEGAEHVELVIDNGSTDRSVGELQSRFPGLRVLENGSNLGFAGACNVGIREALQAGAEFVWLLNNDTIVDRAALAELVRALQSSPQAAFAGSKIYYASRPDVLWFAGGDLPIHGSEPCHRGLDEPDLGRYDEPTPCGFITGCSLLVRTTAIASIGLMPEDYFLYWEDVDWNERAAAAGMERLYVPTSKVWHKVSASSRGEAGSRHPRMDRYSMRNFILFHRRHRPRGLALALLRGWLRTLKMLLVERRPKQSAAALRGMIDASAGRIGPISD